MAGKRLIAFTVEAEVRERDAPKFGEGASVKRNCFRSYRFDGAAWKQLADWRDAVSEKSMPAFCNGLDELIPVYQPVVLGDDVFVYYVAKEQSTEVPRVHKFDLPDSE